MNIQQVLNQRFKQAFTPEYLEVRDESHGHSRGDNSHFKAIIVSNTFEQTSRINRHRAVMAQAQDLMNNPVHALAIHAYTPQEWADKNRTAPNSPKCQGAASSH